MAGSAFWDTFVAPVMTVIMFSPVLDRCEQVIYPDF
jgi:hypothetical protein